MGRRGGRRPRAGRSGRGGDSPVGVDLEELCEQLPCLCGDLGVLLGGGLQRLFPATNLVSREEAQQHRMHDNACAPHVRRWRHGEAYTSFRRRVYGGARSAQACSRPVARPEGDGQAEVDQPNLHLILGHPRPWPLDHDILRLQVAMYHAMPMAVRQRPEELPQDPRSQSLVLAVATFKDLLDILEELYPIDVLHNQVDAAVGLKCLEEPAYMRVVQLLQHSDLLPHAPLGCCGARLDRLHRTEGLRRTSQPRPAHSAETACTQRLLLDLIQVG
mmetsp:Transcript_69032/g.200299  ORF Transcript_69032/g.200299 Transcript_69032/m.200299 type:complete len:274 (+) Transcript_69032:327-1148(+)